MVNYGQNDGPAAATRARAALSDISNSKNSRAGVGGKVVRAACNQHFLLLNLRNCGCCLHLACTCVRLAP